MRIGAMKDSKTKAEESTRLTYTGLAPCSETPSLMSYTRRYDSFTEVGRVYRVALREPMHLCSVESAESVTFVSSSEDLTLVYYE